MVLASHQPVLFPTCLCLALSITSIHCALGPVLFGDSFNGKALDSRWTRDRTAAYEQQSHNVKPVYNKLDLISPSHVRLEGGHAIFTAKRSDITLENGKKAWITGHLTTEYTAKPIKLFPGYFIQIRFQLPSAVGAWPCLMSWHSATGDNEVDSFEYHPDDDSKHILELTSHIHPRKQRPIGKAYSNPSQIYPGAWITLGTYYGVDNIQWYLHDSPTPIFEDRRGVGAGWNASVNLHLAVAAGYAPPGQPPYHDPPKVDSFEFKVDWIAVYKGHPYK